MSSQKRVQLLIDTQPANTTLVLVGNGPCAETYRKMHDSARGLVCLTGEMVSQGRLRQFYKAADLHISASNFETLGNTPDEALLCFCTSIMWRTARMISS